MLSEKDDNLPIPCPSCDTDLTKGKKLTGADLLACGFSTGGG